MVPRPFGGLPSARDQGQGQGSQGRQRWNRGSTSIAVTAQTWEGAQAPNHPNRTENIVMYRYYPGGLRPGRRAPGDFAEEGAFQNIFFTEICLRILILLNPFFCVFLETFSSGGVPPDTCFIDF